MKPIPNQPDLVAQVFESIRDAICDGQFRPGQRLHQDELATQLGVSRQPVVQALHLLKSQGFARDTGRRGVEVTALGVSETAQHYRIRTVLDGLAAREAAANCDIKAARQRGSDIIRAGRTACQSGRHRDILDADMAFHQFIYDLSDNPVIAKTVMPLWHQLRRIMGAAITTDYPVNAIWDEHQKIFDAILAGDPGGAETLARAHGDTAAQRVQQMQAERSSLTDTMDQPISHQKQ